MRNRVLRFSFIFLLLPFFVYSVDLKDFYKLFPDIPEWEASEPIGGRINIDNIYTLRVERLYKSEDKYLKFSIIGGNEAESLWRPFLLKISYEHDNEWRKIEKTGKELLGVYYNKSKKTGELVFPIEKGKKVVGIFLMEFKNISSHEALSIFKKTDLEGLKKLVLKDLQDFKVFVAEQKKTKKK